MIYARTIRQDHRSRRGWRVVWNEYRPAKRDGSPDMRCETRGKGRELHIHNNGHKRLYINNLLQAERYKA